MLFARAEGYIPAATRFGLGVGRAVTVSNNQNRIEVVSAEPFSVENVSTVGIDDGTLLIVEKFGAVPIVVQAFVD